MDWFGPDVGMSNAEAGCSPSVAFIVTKENSETTFDSSSMPHCSVDFPKTITPAADPALTVEAKCALDVSDDNDDDVVNKNAKKAKRAHIADDDDSSANPIKMQKKTLILFSGTLTAKKTMKTASRICRKNRM